MNKLLQFIVIIGLTFSPVFLHAQHLFSVDYNELSKEHVNQLKAQIADSEISALSLTKNNENKDVFPVAFSSVQESKLVIFNEQTENHVVVTPVEDSLTEFQLSPFFIEELRQSVLGDAGYYLVMETTSDFALKKVSSVPASNGDVYVPDYFYGTKENVQEALPQDRQILYVFKQKPRIISAFPDDPEQQSYIAQLEEELSYYIYMFKLPDGTLCTYDEHFNPDNNAPKSKIGENLVFNLSGSLTTQQHTTTSYALELWSQQLAGTVPVDINVSVISLGGTYLGFSYNMQSFLNTSTNTWYPSSLWNQLVGYDVTSLRDIRIEMNSDFTFYWGLDGNTSGYDYVTIMLHEVCHGLGFFPLCSSNGSYYYTASDGYSHSTNYPGIFDRQLFQGTTGSCLTELTQSQRAALLVSNNLYAGAPGSHLLQAHGSRVKMYAPTTYSPGSSNSHWDNNPGFSNFMQYAYQYPLHTFNARKIGILLDLGWTLPSTSSCNPPTNLTVNYTSDCQAQLSWQAPTGKGKSVITPFTPADENNAKKELARGTFTENVESHANFTINSTVNGWSYIDGDSSNTYTPDNNIYNIYRDNFLIKSSHTGTSYIDTDFNTSRGHIWTVKQVCTNGESDGVNKSLGACSGECNPVTNLTVNYTSDCNAQLSWQAPTNDDRAVILSESFPTGTLPAEWTTLNVDGDAYTWQFTTRSDNIDNNCPSIPSEGRTDAYSINSASFYNCVGSLYPDNWLITPGLPSTGNPQLTLTYWVKAIDNDTYDHYGVYISTTGTNPSNFTLLFEETLTSANANWTQRTVNITQGRNFHIAFRHFNSNDVYNIMCIDDILVSTNTSSTFYNIYRDNVLIKANHIETSYTDTGFNTRIGHTWTVRHVCSSGESDPTNVTKPFCSTNTITATSNDAAYLYYFNDAIYFKNVPAETTVQMFDVCGKLIHQAVLTGESIPFFHKGFYIVKLIYSNNTVVTKKIVAYL